MKQVVAMAIVLLFSTVASAQVIIAPTTNARMDALGVPNHQIDDDFNIFINPAQVSNYKNAFYAEFGVDSCTLCGDSATETGQNDRATDAFGGMNMEMGGALGVWVGRPYESVLSGMLVPGGLEPSANRIDLFFAPAGTPFGVYLGYANQSEDFDSGVLSGDFDFTEYNLAAGANLMDGAAEVALNLGLADAEHNDTTTLGTATSEADALHISVLGRLHRAMGDAGTLISTGRVLWADGEVDKEDFTLIDVLVDTALNCTMHPGALMIAGIGIHYSDLSNGFEETVIELPLNLAIEHQTFEKVKTRFGASKALYRSVETTISGTPPAPDVEVDSVEDGSATVSFGLGWHPQDNLAVDFVVNQDVLFTGTYLVSGVSETLAGKVSASWKW